MIRIGILGAADIAKRRFLPALKDNKEYEFAGVASSSKDVSDIISDFGGRAYNSYDELLNDDSIDAVYIPLPPSFHFKWGKKALEANKHVYMEKPFTISYEDTRELVNLAEEKNLAIYENYGFTFNDQIRLIKELMSDGESFGDLRLIRGYFGFPKRADSDFRYSAELGGGALLDCGGYTLKLARFFLGDDITLLAATKQMMPGHDVDGWGSVMVRSRDGVCAQLSFGMDNQYKCEAEFWGSIGTIHAGRIFTPPPSFVPKLTLTTSKGQEVFEAKNEDAFSHAQNAFVKCVNNQRDRDEEYFEILNQARIVNEAEDMMNKF